MPLFLRCEPGTRLTIISKNVDGTGFPMDPADALRLRLYRLENDGTLYQYDFSSNTFKSGVCTTEYATMTHRTTQATTRDTLLFTYVLSTLTGFTAGTTYIVDVENHSNADAPESLAFRYMADGSVMAVETSGLPAIANAVLAASTAGAAEGTLGGDVKLAKAAAVNTLVADYDAGTTEVYDDDGETSLMKLQVTTTETGKRSERV